MVSQKQSSSVFLIVGAIVAVCGATFGIATLNNQANRAAQHEQELNHLQAIANRLDALEWRAIAKKKIDADLEEDLQLQRREAQRTLVALQATTDSLNHLEKIESAYQAYASAVNQLLNLLISNQVEKALEIDNKKVDPSYDELYALIQFEIKEASNKYNLLNYWSSLGSIVILLSLVTTLGMVFQQYLRVYRQVQQMTIDAMRTQQNKLNEERQLLEAKVSERTEELQQTNVALSKAMLDLQQSQVQLIQSEKMSMLGQLVAGIAHEINNPVGFLLGNIQPALDYIHDLFDLIDLYQEAVPEPSKEIQEHIYFVDLDYIRDDLPKLIDSMKEGVIRIRDISTSLRTFSRGDNDLPAFYDIHDGIDSTLLILKYRLKANENRPAIEVIKNYGTLPPIECYVGPLNQVFMNLLANAIESLEESNQGRSFQEIQAKPNVITIETKMSNDLQHVILSIKDNGVGMTDDVQSKLFEHRFTTKAVGKGTGLGLTIAYSIVVDKHHGSLEVNSTPGEGAEFVIRIPITTQTKKTLLLK